MEFLTTKMSNEVLRTYRDHRNLHPLRPEVDTHDGDPGSQVEGGDSQQETEDSARPRHLSELYTTLYEHHTDL